MQLLQATYSGCHFGDLSINCASLELKVNQKPILKKCASMNKKDNTMDESVEDSFKESYCKDVTTILTKNASDYSTTLKVTEKLQRERLRLEHAQIEQKITVVLKRIEESQQEAQDFDRQIYNATELKNQAMTRFERTGEMINVLRDEAEKIKGHSKKIETKRLEITKKVQELTEQKLKNEESKKNIERLELEIRDILDAPEPKFGANLVQENIDLKKKLEQRIANLQIKRMIANKADDLKNRKIELLQDVSEKQERNKAFKEGVAKKKECLKDNEQNMQEKLNQAQESYNKDTERKNELLEDLKKYVQHTEEMQKRIEETNEKVAEKEKELQELKKKIEIRQNYTKEENEKKKEEYELEEEKLRNAEQKLQESLDENEEYVKEISKNSERIMTLKEQKGDLIVELCDKKTQLVIQQHQNTNQQTKIDILSEKLDNEIRQVEEIRAKNADLEGKFEESKKKLEDHPAEFTGRHEMIASNHKEKAEALMKQQNFQEATIEFLQFRLDGNITKIEKLQKEVKELAEGIKWEEMKYGMRKKTAEKLQERAIKEQAAYEKLVIQLKQKEEEKKKNPKGAILERREPLLPLFNDTKQVGAAKNKSPAKVMISLEERDVVEVEEDDKKSQSGRKSPGILKTPYKKPNQQQNKHVTFEGLSSTESSSISVRSAEGAEKSPELEDHNMDELLQDWANTTYTSSTSGKRRLMDF